MILSVRIGACMGRSISYRTHLRSILPANSLTLREIVPVKNAVS